MKIKLLFPVTLILFFFVIFIIFLKGLKNTNIYTPSLDYEKNIPQFTALIFDTNKKISSNEIFKSDQFYLMNIWSSWCIPCRDEHKFLISLSEQKNLKIIGLNYKDKTQKAKNFLKEFKSPYKTIISDNDGTIAIDWGAYGVPETFVIYKKKIIKKIIGPINNEIYLKIKKIIE